MDKAKKLSTEVLIVGGGAAGLRAALAAAETGSQVLVVNKGPIGRSGISLTAAGGLQAPFHPDDSPEAFYDDTVRCGYDLGDRNLVRILAEGACDAILDAERYGVRFVKNDAGQFALGQFPGQSHPRNIFVKGGGIGLVAALARACRERENVTLLEDFFVTSILIGQSGNEKTAAGVMGLYLPDGSLTQISARAVVMATGGCQWLWEVNDCPADAVGDGIVYAYQAGAELTDMEMVLFYPSVIVWPPSVKGAFVHYEFLAEALLDGNVYDKAGAPILPKPLPVRDEAMRIMASAIRDGRGGDHGGLYWYVGNSPKGEAVVRKQLDTLQYNYIKTLGIDPATARIEVAPGAHYLMGGIRINDQCQSSLPGLFAAPECAGNFDGANRLAGSGLAATQVFGKKAGAAAGCWAAGHEAIAADPASLEQETGRVAGRLAAKPSGGKLNVYRQQLRSAVQAYAGVSRTEQGLKELSKLAGEIKTRLAGETVPDQPVFNQNLLDLLQLETMCETAGLIAGSALLRREARGHHFREDYPVRDDVNWLKHTVVARRNDTDCYDVKPVVLL